MQIVLETLTVNAEPALTAALYREARPVDPLCCNACATLAYLVREQLLPVALTDFLRTLGVTLAAPVEAWGAPDGGFLQVWWPVVIHPPLPSTVVDIGDGAVLTLTEHYPQPAHAASPEYLLPAVELTWDSKLLVAIEGRAWHRAAARPDPSSSQHRRRPA